MNSPEDRAARAQVQHHAGIPPIRPSSAQRVPLAVRLRWAGQCFTAAYQHEIAGRSVEAALIAEYGMDQLAALRTEPRR